MDLAALAAWIKEKTASGIPATLDDLMELFIEYELDRPLPVKVKIESVDTFDPDLPTIKIIGPTNGKPGEIYILGRKIENGADVARLFHKYFFGFEENLINDFLKSIEGNIPSPELLITKWNSYRLKKNCIDILKGDEAPVLDIPPSTFPPPDGSGKRIAPAEDAAPAAGADLAPADRGDLTDALNYTKKGLALNMRKDFESGLGAAGGPDAPRTIPIPDNMIQPSEPWPRK